MPSDYELRRWAQNRAFVRGAYEAAKNTCAVFGFLTLMALCVIGPAVFFG